LPRDRLARRRRQRPPPRPGPPRPGRIALHLPRTLARPARPPRTLGAHGLTRYARFRSVPTFSLGTHAYWCAPRENVGRERENGGVSEQDGRTTAIERADTTAQTGTAEQTGAGG